MALVALSTSNSPLSRMVASRIDLAAITDSSVSLQAAARSTTSPMCSCKASARSGFIAEAGIWCRESSSLQIVCNELKITYALALNKPRSQSRRTSAGAADSGKSQKQITLSGEQLSWGSSDIDHRASSIDDFKTKALRAISFF